MHYTVVMSHKHEEMALPVYAGNKSQFLMIKRKTNMEGPHKRKNTIWQTLYIMYGHLILYIEIIMVYLRNDGESFEEY